MESRAGGMQERLLFFSCTYAAVRVFSGPNGYGGETCREQSVYPLFDLVNPSGCVRFMVSYVFPDRSPRPDDQYSPKRGEDGDGYSSGSPSPRGRRNHAAPWADSEDHQRSLSQPRAMTRDQHSAPPDNRSASTRRGGERGDRGGAYPGSPGLAPHLDIYGSAPSSMGIGIGIGSGTSSGLHGGSSHNGRMAEAFNLHDAHHRGPNGRPLSLPANSGARGIHQWDPRAAGSGTPIPSGSRSGRASPPQLSESVWLQEIERRRRDMGYRGSVDGEHRIGAGHEREHDRRMPQERQRSMQHLERRHVNGGGGVDDQVRLPRVWFIFSFVLSFTFVVYLLLVVGIHAATVFFFVAG